MKEEEMLYCLIAFILGWLVSRHMGNGFSVGGQDDDVVGKPECNSFKNKELCLSKRCMWDTANFPEIIEKNNEEMDKMEEQQNQLKEQQNQLKEQIIEHNTNLVNLVKESDNYESCMPQLTCDQIVSKMEEDIPDQDVTKMKGGHNVWARRVHKLQDTNYGGYGSFDEFTNECSSGRSNLMKRLREHLDWEKFDEIPSNIYTSPSTMEELWDQRDKAMSNIKDTDCKNNCRKYFIHIIIPMILKLSAVSASKILTQIIMNINHYSHIWTMSGNEIIKNIDYENK